MENTLELPQETPALTPAERKALRARAHALEPVVMVGSAALSPPVIGEIDRALEHHELIKVRVLGADRDERELLYAQACEACKAHPVQHLGRMLILYRPRPAEAATPNRADVARSKTSRSGTPKPGTARATPPRSGARRSASARPATARKTGDASRPASTRSGRR
jgi:putative YhbY family RNA-binding protein